VRVTQGWDNTSPDTLNDFDKHLMVVLVNIKLEDLDEFFGKTHNLWGLAEKSFLLIKCLAMFLIEKIKQGGAASDWLSNYQLADVDALLKKYKTYSVFLNWVNFFLGLDDSCVKLIPLGFFKEVMEFICEQSPIKKTRDHHFELVTNWSPHTLVDGWLSSVIDRSVQDGKQIWLSASLFLMDGVLAKKKEGVEKKQKNKSVSIESHLLVRIIEIACLKPGLLLPNTIFSQSIGVVLDYVFSDNYEYTLGRYQPVLKKLDEVGVALPGFFTKVVTLLYSDIYAKDRIPDYTYKSYLFYFSLLKQFFPKSYIAAGADRDSLYNNYRDELFDKMVSSPSRVFFNKLIEEKLRSDQVVNGIANAAQAFIFAGCFAEARYVREFLGRLSKAIASEKKILSSTNSEEDPSLLRQPAIIKIFMIARLLGVKSDLSLFDGSSIKDGAFKKADMTTDDGKILLVRRWFKHRFSLLMGGLKKQLTSEAERAHFKRFAKYVQDPDSYNAQYLVAWLWENPVPYKQYMYYPRALMKCCQALCGDDKKLREKAYIEIETLGKKLNIFKPVAEGTAVVNGVSGVGGGMGSDTIDGGSTCKLLKVQGVSGGALTTTQASADSDEATQNINTERAPGGAGGGAGAHSSDQLQYAQLNR
jgi:hypothetical protein